MAKRLLMQSDDFGMTDGVTDGIIKAIEFGLIRNTGLFVNMPASYRAIEKIKDKDVCLGIDINYVCGKPVSKTEQVPHMVDEDGFFYSSGSMASKSKLLKMDDLGLVSTFETDPYPYEEILLETENQVKKFIEMTGQKPEYMHLHSLMSENCYRAAKEVSNRYGIIHSLDVMKKHPLLPGTFGAVKGDYLEAQMEYDVVGNLMDNALPSMSEDETRMFVCHCGYVDYDLFENTSLTLRRVKDLSAMTNAKLKEYIEKQGIEIITYGDL